VLRPASHDHSAPDQPAGDDAAAGRSVRKIESSQMRTREAFAVVGRTGPIDLNRPDFRKAVAGGSNGVNETMEGEEGHEGRRIFII